MMAESQPPSMAGNQSDYSQGINSRKREGDPFPESAFSPPRSNHWKMIRRRSKYYNHASSLCSSRERLARSGLGSNSNLNLDPIKMMNMQDEAKSKRISTEVMKNKLYASVVASPHRRRMSMSVRSDVYHSPQEQGAGDFGYYNPLRMAVSLPVTPAHSEQVTPCHSPTSERKFQWGYFSRGTTPDEDDKQFAELVDSGNRLGLASFLKPLPRCLPANRSSQNIPEAMADDEEEEMCI